MQVQHRGQDERRRLQAFETELVEYLVQGLRLLRATAAACAHKTDGPHPTPLTLYPFAHDRRCVLLPPLPFRAAGLLERAPTKLTVPNPPFPKFKP